jgi:Ca-activated chloride channel family protein
MNSSRSHRRLLIVASAALAALAPLVYAAGQVSKQKNPAPKSSTTRPAPESREPGEGDGDVVSVSSNLVVVPVSVTDARGRPVEGLTAGDFRLEEEGRPQEIAAIGDPEQVPLELAILIDVSGSVRARFGFEKEAAALFIKSVLKPTDQAVLYAIDQTPRLEQARAGADQVAEKLRAVEFTDMTTAFYDTVVDAAQYLNASAPARHRRVILVISDGEDTYSEKVRSIEETVTAVQHADAIFYSINPPGDMPRPDLLDRRGQREMQTLATATGGTAFAPDKLENLDTVFQQIAAELRSQYLLEYYEKSDAPPGSFLRIRVRVPKQPGLNIRARQGYYLPKR